MDPNTNYQQQLEHARYIMAAWDRLTGTEDLTSIEHDARNLAELVLSLHTWIENGGFLPTQLEKK